MCRIEIADCELIAIRVARWPNRWSMWDRKSGTWKHSDGDPWAVLAGFSTERNRESRAPRRKTLPLFPLSPEDDLRPPVRERTWFRRLSETRVHASLPSPVENKRGLPTPGYCDSPIGGPILAVRQNIVLQPAFTALFWPIQLADPKGAPPREPEGRSCGRRLRGARSRRQRTSSTP